MINVHIIGTSQIKTLAIETTEGHDWTIDLIGGAGMLGHPAEDGGFAADEDQDNLYHATQDTYDWWSKYISDLEDTESDLDDLSNDLWDNDLDAMSILHKEYYDKPGGVDMEGERGQAVELIADIRRNYLGDKS